MTANGASRDIVRLAGLSVHYGSFCAFRATDLVVPHGAIGLLGPNGAGKSTLIKVLLGLLRPRDGSGTVLGLAIREHSSEIRARVGYMAENDSFVPGLTAVQFVSLAGELAGMTPRDALRRAHEVLTYLDLEEARYRRVEEFSTGMKQRFKLAQALVHDPELLILDEPTNGLDPGGRRTMLDLIRSLHRDFGKSVILATHLLEDVDRVCDHLVLLDSGAVVAHGRIDELREHWKDRFRLRLDGDPTSFIDALGGAGGEVISREASPGSHVELVVRLPEGRRCRDVIELVASLGDRAAVLRSIGPDRERLGDLFRRIVVDRRAPLAGDSTGPSGDDGGRSRVATA